MDKEELLKKLQTIIDHLQNDKITVHEVAQKVESDVLPIKTFTIKYAVWER